MPLEMGVGLAMSISASDLERHTYCPMSWHLSREGIGAKGEAVVEGVRRHAEIHSTMEEARAGQQAFRRSATIWSWWFTVVLVFALEGFIIYRLLNSDASPVKMARFLSTLGLSSLFAGVLLILLPWREPLDWSIPDSRTEFESSGVMPILNPPDFIGGWFQGGRLEASFLLASIVFGLHALALSTFLDAENAAFVLVISAFLWTGLASWRLQVLLLAHQKSEVARVKAGLDEKTEVIYSDDEQGAGLLKDPNTGLRGRPDQIVIVDGDFIPVEQKTGKIPSNPHESHRMQLLAYLHLVECETGRSSPYGVIRYGEHHIFQVPWDNGARADLFSAIEEVQRLMEEGGARRNHERVGKCRNCSRRHACPERLDASA
ncbi:MAG: hypothetical protein CMA56_02200 [Euryarchaeota archaeon]|nr:hypothetical protein [Euryarchaeota archaeon]